ncbi:Uncharacterized beta-barrel protein YwiB, DUF1934 family [Mesobacillus persicus]|uniref:Uncharacterized beta-barrel protein YwiB, DUF1934 family n=1 Tax=Mesobacillus persicus TaxID=930146 RepID=A0A1H8GQJ6_9BACI|nr:DUF1934 family protein [Mesobacillus persicus]SEN46292.1 Uncharacterized beta-barrel protein YwiB, DUF1934 family [Mesobacillus persicus]
MSSNAVETIPVKVHVKNMINKELYELTAFGRYSEKGASRYLQYDEVMPEGTTHTTVKVKEGEVLILRKGAVDMRLHFILDKKTSGNIKTTHGLMMTEADTKRILLAEGRVEVAYELTIQGSLAGTYEMKIEYEEVSE